MFRIIHKDSRTRARLGVLSTPHGTIQTPSYVIVATHAEVKCLKPSDIKKTKTQIVICNTYHLWDSALASRGGASRISFVHKRLGANIPIMTDSGGFQVFSLGFGQENRIGKILNPEDNRLAKSIIHRGRNVKITEKGVCFMINGEKRFLGPELSIKIQEKLGADIIFAFDECTSFFDDFKYNRKAMERTHKWALTSLKVKIKNEKLRKRGKQQMLFGIVQGGRYKQLRVQSAKFIGSLPFDGFGIGKRADEFSALDSQ